MLFGFRNGENFWFLTEEKLVSRIKKMETTPHRPLPPPSLHLENHEPRFSLEWPPGIGQFGNLHSFWSMFDIVTTFCPKGRWCFLEK